MKLITESCCDGPPNDEGDELFDCEGDKVTIDEQDMVRWNHFNFNHEVRISSKK